MHVVCTPEIPATVLSWRSRRSELVHTVICKATYSLEQGKAVLAQDHEPLNDGDQHWEDSEQRSLRAASDLIPFKRRADVIVVGAVFAPPGTSTRRIIARLAVGPVDKLVVAFCDRSVDRDGVITEGRPFSRMPLVYERAQSGADSDNPVGRAPTRDSVGKLNLPNFQPVAFEPEPPDFFVPSIGMGPIAGGWPSRTRHLGGHAALPPSALLERPEDFDASYFNVAPYDQQLDELPSNAHLVLEALNAEHPRLVTRLPGDRARALVDLAGIDLNLVCDTLWIDTERAICTLTWRGSFRAETPAPNERVIVALEGADMKISVEALRKSVSSGERTMMLKARSDAKAVDRPALPFGGGSAPARSASSLAGTPFQSASGGVAEARRAPSPVPPPPLALEQHVTLEFSTHGLSADDLPIGPASQALRPVAPPQTTPKLVPSSPPSAAPPLPAPSPAAPPAPAPVPVPVAALPPAPPPPRLATPSVVALPPPSQRAQVPAYLVSPPTAVTPPASVAHDARAAYQGVESASNAAASTGKVESPKKAALVAPQSSAGPKRPRAFLDLLWFDDGAADRIREQPSWTEALKGSRKGSSWLTKPPPADAAKRGLEPRRVVARALTRVGPVDSVGVQNAIVDSIDEDGFFDRPLVVLEGELALTYSPLEALRTSIALAAPLGAADKKLKDQLDAAIEVAKAEGRSTAAMIDSALTRLRAAFQVANKVYPPGYLETTTERLLVEERSYLKRIVLGGPKLIASLSPPSGNSLAIYLPDSVGVCLPLLPQFRARVIAEPHARQDAADSDGTVLLVLALGRVVAESA